VTRQETCRSCGAPIIWTRTAFNGKPIPIDLAPTDNGNILLQPRDTERHIALVLPPGDERITTETTYTTHFATCPDSDQWRRRTHA
jgi:hypothetical protein